MVTAGVLLNDTIRSTRQAGAAILSHSATHSPNVIHENPAL